jgi:hypothetical protein
MYWSSISFGLRWDRNQWYLVLPLPFWTAPMGIDGPGWPVPEVDIGKREVVAVEIAVVVAVEIAVVVAVEIAVVVAVGIAVAVAVEIAVVVAVGIAVVVAVGIKIKERHNEECDNVSNLET